MTPVLTRRLMETRTAEGIRVRFEIMIMMINLYSLQFFVCVTNSMRLSQRIRKICAWSYWQLCLCIYRRELLGTFARTSDSRSNYRQKDSDVWHKQGEHLRTRAGPNKCAAVCLGQG